MFVKTIRLTALAIGAVLAAGISANTVQPETDSPLQPRMRRYYHLHQVVMPSGMQIVDTNCIVPNLNAISYGNTAEPIALCSAQTGASATIAPSSEAFRLRYETGQAASAPTSIQGAAPGVATTGRTEHVATVSPAEPVTGLGEMLQPLVSSAAGAQSEVEDACYALALGTTRAASAFAPSLNGLALMRSVESTVAGRIISETRGPSVVPEPSSLLMLGTFFPVLAMTARRKRAIPV